MISRHPTRKLRQILFTGPPQPIGFDEIARPGAADSGLFAEHLLRSSRSGLPPKDPARKVKVPKQLRESDKTTLTWDQLRRVLKAVGLRDRVLVELDMTNALRPSELFGLRWKRFNYK